MGEQIRLHSADGFEFGAYAASPKGTPKAGVVVLQEIFGVNHHIRSIADRLAAEGYLTVTPALFDRYERGFEVGYDEAGTAKGMALLQQFTMERAEADVLAAVNYARDEYKTKVGVLGFCLGGSLAWLTAAKMPVDAAVGYYGGFIAKCKDASLHAPILLHFGADDGHIPASDVEAIRTTHPEVPVHVYAGAGHGFNCDERASWNEAAAREAWTRTLAFLAEHLGGPLEDRGTKAR